MENIEREKENLSRLVLFGILLHQLQHRERLPEKTACGRFLIFMMGYFNELDVGIGAGIRYEVWKLFFKVWMDDKNIHAVKGMLFEVSDQVSDIFGMVTREDRKRTRLNSSH